MRTLPIPQTVQAPMLVKLLRASAQDIQLAFRRTSPDMSMEPLTISKSELKHINTDQGFCWWHIGTIGTKPSSWMQAARAYAKRHGMAVVVHQDCTASIVFTSLGLCFFRFYGELERIDV